MPTPESTIDEGTLAAVGLRWWRTHRGVLIAVEFIEESQCAPRYSTEPRIVTDHLQLYGHTVAIHVGHNESAVLPTRCYAVPFFWSALFRRYHAVSILQGRVTWLSPVEINRHDYRKPACVQGGFDRTFFRCDIHIAQASHGTNPPFILTAQ